MMNSKQDLVNIGEAYGNIFDKLSLIAEKKQTAKKGIAPGSFKTATDKKVVQAESNPEPYINKNSGPAKADGFNKDIVDPAQKKKKGKDFYEAEKFSQVKTEKTETKDINNYMKSTFDKLFEDVMSGEDVLDHSPEAAGEIDDHAGSPEHEEHELEGEKDVVAKLSDAIEMLQQVVDELSGAENEVEDLEAGNEGDDESGIGEEDEQQVAGEATDIKELGDDHGKKLTNVKGKSNVVGDATDKLAGKGSADSKTTDKVGNDGDEGTPLVNQKKGKPDAVKGKSNVVSSRLKVGQSIGEQN